MSRGAWKQACPVLRGPGHGNMTRLPDQWRGIATRYEKTATVYLAGLHIAGIFLWSAR
ncbi:hypothetical protein Srubr_35580 [Streptomyces rubradiris]|uniref:Transposase n=1 Tax=Streptomyces rubradiris TaxID=285531 RepID=A0ABQ3RCX6_STRRR|nr:hypothetical protein Srubr_35580 [Streptomyces rubradiris]